MTTQTQSRKSVEALPLGATGGCGVRQVSTLSTVQKEVQLNRCMATPTNAATQEAKTENAKKTVSQKKRFTLTATERIARATNSKFNQKEIVQMERLMRQMKELGKKERKQRLNGLRSEKVEHHINLGINNKIDTIVKDVTDSVEKLVTSVTNAKADDFKKHFESLTGLITGTVKSESKTLRGIISSAIAAVLVAFAVKQKSVVSRMALYAAIAAIGVLNIDLLEQLGKYLSNGVNGVIEYTQERDMRAQEAKFRETLARRGIYRRWHQGREVSFDFSHCVRKIGWDNLVLAARRGETVPNFHRILSEVEQGPDVLEYKPDFVPLIKHPSEPSTSKEELHAGDNPILSIVSLIGDFARKEGLMVGKIGPVVAKMATSLRSITGITNGVKSMFEIIRMLINWVSGESTEGNLLFDQGRLKGDMEEWVKESDSQLCSVFSREVGLSYTKAETVIRHAERGFAIRARLIAAQGPTNVTTQNFEKALLTYKSILDTALTVVHDSGHRPVPVGVLLPGGAGIGKTTFLNRLMTDVMNYLYPGVAHGPRDFYRRNDEDEFWSGYHGQTCTLFDDVLKTNDPVAITKELMTIQSAIDYVSWPLNMAAMDEKGKEFRSELVAMTTNAAWPDPSIIDPGNNIKGNMRDFEAIQRRVHFRVALEVKEPYALKGAGAGTKLKAGDVRRAKATIDQVYNINVTQITDNQEFVTISMTYSELVQAVVRDARERKVQFQRNVEDIKTDVPSVRQIPTDKAKELIESNNIAVAPVVLRLIDRGILPYHPDFETWRHEMRMQDRECDEVVNAREIHAILTAYVPEDESVPVPTSAIYNAMRGCKSSLAAIMRFFIDQTKAIYNRVFSTDNFIWKCVPATTMRDNITKAKNAIEGGWKKGVEFLASIKGVGAVISAILSAIALVETLVRVERKADRPVHFDGENQISWDEVDMNLYNQWQEAWDASTEDPVVGTVTLQSDTRKVARVPVRTRNVAKHAPRKMQKTEHHAGNASSTIPDLFLNQLVEIGGILREGSGSVRSLGIFLDETSILTCTHVVVIIDKTVKTLLINTQEHDLQYEWKDLQVYAIPGSDISIIKVPRVNGIRSLKRFLKPVPTGEEDFRQSDIYRLSRREGTNYVLHASKARVLDAEDSGKSPVVERSLLTDLTSVRGESGGPMLETDKTGRTWLIGIHRGVWEQRASIGSLFYDEELDLSRAEEEEVEEHMYAHYDSDPDDWWGAPLDGEPEGGERASPEPDPLDQDRSDLRYEFNKYLDRNYPDDCLDLYVRDGDFDYYPEDRTGLQEVFEANNIAALRINPQLIPRRATKTKLKESPVKGWLPESVDIKRPANISERGYMLTRRAVCDLKPCEIEKHPCYKKALCLVREQLHDAMLDSGAEVIHMTYDRAVRGSDHLRFFQHVDMKTSAGLPYTARISAPAKKKAEVLFSASGDLAAEVFNDIDKMIADVMKGKTLQSYFISTDCLKDELRPIAKVDKPRVFSVMPVMANVLTRATFGNAMDALMQSRKEHPIKVGINPYSSFEWETAIVYVGGRDYAKKEYICGDFSAFDKTMSGVVIRDAIRVLTEWYHLVEPDEWEERNIPVDERIFRSADEHERVADAIAYALSNNIHMADDHIYLARGGNPSGNAMTVIINSIVNYIYLTCVHIARTGREETPACIIYGDDYVSRKYPEYDFFDVANELKPYGIRMQAATKDGNELASNDISTTTFLKRHFTPQQFGCVAEMKLMDVLPSLCWYRDDESIEDACNMALREIFLMGSENFDYWRKHFHAAAVNEKEMRHWRIATYEQIAKSIAVMLTGIPIYGDMQDAFEKVWREMKDAPSRRVRPAEIWQVTSLFTDTPPEEEFSQLLSSSAPPAISSSVEEHVLVIVSCDTPALNSTSINSTTNNIGNYDYNQNGASGEGTSEPFPQEVIDDTHAMRTELDGSTPDSVKTLVRNINNRLNQVLLQVLDTGGGSLLQPTLQELKTAFDVGTTSSFAKQNLLGLGTIVNSVDANGVHVIDNGYKLDDVKGKIDNSNALLQQINQTMNAVHGDTGNLSSIKTYTETMCLNLDPTMPTSFATKLLQKMDDLKTAMEGIATGGKDDNDGAYMLIGEDPIFDTDRPARDGDGNIILYNYAEALDAVRYARHNGKQRWLVPYTGLIGPFDIKNGELGRFSAGNSIDDYYRYCCASRGAMGVSLFNVRPPDEEEAQHQKRLIRQLVPLADEIKRLASLNVSDPQRDSDPNELREHFFIEEHASVEEEVRVEQVEINTFTTTGDVEEAQVGDFLPDPGMEGIDQSAILNFVQRELRLTTLNWNVSQQRGKLVYVVDPLREILSRVEIQRKLAGWRYMTTDVKITMRVTGTKFMGGRLAAIWIPPNRVQEMSNFNTLHKVTAIQNRVFLHPTDNGTYTMCLPGMLTRRAFDLSKAGLGWDTNDACVDLVTCGLLAIYVISPFVTDDAIDTATVSIWAELENTSLCSTYDPNVTLSGVTSTLPTEWQQANTDADLRLLTNFVTDVRRFAQLDSSNRVEEHVLITEVGGGKGKTKTPPKKTTEKPKAKPSVKEAYFAHTPFAASFYAAASILSNASFFVPMLKPLSFVAYAAGAVLGWFKKDRPVERLPPTRVLPKWKDMSRCDGVDETTHLGLKMNNSALPIGPGQPIDPEELLIGRLCGIPSTIMARQITSTTLPNQIIMEWAVGPWNMPCTPPKKAGTTANSAMTFIAHSFASFIANCFMWWRGTCVIEVDVVAQGFSKALLGITWLPGDAERDMNVTPYPEFNAQNVISSDVYNHARTSFIQLEGSGVLTFEVPFNTSEYWLNSCIEVLGARGNFSTNEIGTNGKIVVFVVNPPTTISTAEAKPIDVLLNVGWKDLTFMRPTTSQLSCTGHGAHLESLTAGNRIELHAYTEGDVFGGETVDDVLELARRPTYLGKHTQTSTLLNDCVTTSVFSHPPVVLQLTSPDVINRYDVTNYKPRMPQACNNFILYLSRMYLTWRGEVSYTAVNFTMTVDGSAELASETAPMLLGNVVDRSRTADFEHKIEIVEGKNTDILPATVSAPCASTFGGGASYRPINTPGMPASVSVPFYAARSYFLTPDMKHVSHPAEGDPNTNTFYLRINYFDQTYPGVRIESGAVAGVTSYLYASASDNFAYGLLYAPPSSSHLICPGRGVSDYGVYSSWASLM